MDIHHQLDRLRILKSLTHEDSARIYYALTSEFKTYDQINLVFPAHSIPANGSSCRQCQSDTVA